MALFECWWRSVFSISTFYTMCLLFFKSCLFNGPSKPIQIFKSSISESSSKKPNKKKQSSQKPPLPVLNSDNFTIFAPSNPHPPSHFTPTTAAISKTGVSNHSQSAARYIRTPNARARCLRVRVAGMTNPGSPRTQRVNGLTCIISWDSCLYIYIHIYLVYMFVQKKV